MTKPQLGTFARKYGASPYSVLNAREGWWQKRKKEWIAFGVESQKGRKENLTVSKAAAAFLTAEGKRAFAKRRPK